MTGWNPLEDIGLSVSFEATWMRATWERLPATARRATEAPSFYRTQLRINKRFPIRNLHLRFPRGIWQGRRTVGCCGGRESGCRKYATRAGCANRDQPISAPGPLKGRLIIPPSLFFFYWSKRMRLRFNSLRDCFCSSDAPCWGDARGDDLFVLLKLVILNWNPIRNSLTHYKMNIYLPN